MKFGIASTLLFVGALGGVNGVTESQGSRQLDDNAAHENIKLVDCIKSHETTEYGQCMKGNGVDNTNTGNNNRNNNNNNNSGGSSNNKRPKPRNLQSVMTTTIPDSLILTPLNHESDSTKFMDPCANLPIDPADRTAAGWSTLESNDDKSISTTLPFDFSLYGTLYQKLTSLIYVNNNGNLSFDKSYEDYTASGFPIDGISMIAPFWSDVDTRGEGNGQLWYKVIDDNSFSVIWDRVGYYNEKTDLRNTFQVIISDGTVEKFGIGNGGFNNVCFCYGDMDWSTGSASGGVDGFDGVPATAGINRGINNNYVQLGRFSKTGTVHDGPGGSVDGVDWLDFQGYENFAEGAMASSPVCFDARLDNIAPVVTGFPMDQILAGTCGIKLEFDLTFATPELDQEINAQLPTNIPLGMIVTEERRPNGESVNVKISWTPASDQAGVYDLKFTAQDNYVTPAIVEKILSIKVVGGSCGAGDELPDSCTPIDDQQQMLCEDNPKPHCTPFRSPDHCPADESFPLLVKDREDLVQKYYTDLEIGDGNDLGGHWFQHLEDKGAAYAFTRNNSVPTPPIYCCTDDSEQLNRCFEAGRGRGSPATNFVIRASGLHSTRGIYVFPDGFDGVELISGKSMTIDDVEAELSTMEPIASKIIVEKFIDGRGGAPSGSGPKLPTEFKFHVFNGKIGSVSIFYNRGGDCPCYLEVDDEWERLDKYGCFVPSFPMGKNTDGDTCFDIDFDAGTLNPYTLKGFDLCGPVQKPSDCAWNKMVDIAQTLSSEIGVYMRIDMFLTDDDQIYVQEYTRNHNGGLRHCAAKQKADGCIDSCVLGSMWKNAGGENMFGGPLTVAPDIMQMYQDATVGEEQCDVISMANMKPDFSAQDCRI
eukprot:CAMPEP_0119006542 /NCGR_PEP_ID=MMETSP1176-20130426/2347_1 /TAXON_ID=265551 /ORGANISM="Synedropsis recta cf, Strain CCMP1620" /LENGTH=872 /DNA_ID=CAMNT_0006958459 /DNA_START=29 /DNA_END=2647 /DNA_ORIENTATION=-